MQQDAIEGRGDHDGGSFGIQASRLPDPARQGCTELVVCLREDGLASMAADLA